MIVREDAGMARKARWNVRSMTSRSPCDAGSQARGRERSSRKRPTYTFSSPFSSVFYLRALPFSFGRTFSCTLACFFCCADIHVHTTKPTVRSVVLKPRALTLAPILDETNHFEESSSSRKVTSFRFRDRP